MSEPLYGHDLLSLLVDRGGTCAVADLRAAAAEAHGPQAVYWNCHGENFDFDGVLAFLSSRGKVSLQDGAITLGMASACQH